MCPGGSIPPCLLPIRKWNKPGLSLSVEKEFYFLKRVLQSLFAVLFFLPKWGMLKGSFLFFSVEGGGSTCTVFKGSAEGKGVFVSAAESDLANG